MSQVVTRIAPSPTGYMHIGTARTALFNWLYARGRGGKFLMRIEDTDRERSTPEATDAILRGMEWLGLDFDGDPVSQFENAARHAEVAHDLLAKGKAYKCFSTQDEIQAFRDAARAEGKSTLFQSPWRDADPATHPDAPYVVRIKSPIDGVTVIKDQVQGDVTIRNDQLDDMVLLRSDGTPVYMLAVVVDDHDMGVTHVIRGDDHLNNAARQMMSYSAMDWPLPVYAHIPLIHGEDGKKTVQASRRDVRRRLSGLGLPCGRHAQLFGPFGLEPRGRRIFHRFPSQRLVRFGGNREISGTI
jgi:glutamyl-tRNA synthetase